MKTTFKYSVLLMLIALITKQANAQDFHLTQYDMSPLYINPALTGIYLGEKGDFRAMANYRSQWQKLQGKPFTTAAFSFDKPIKRFGVGAYLMDNIAGRSNYNTFNFVIGAAYIITSEKSKEHYLTTGIQLGMINKKFGQDDLLYTSQYNTTSGFNPAVDNGEGFEKYSILRFDSNFGVFYKYRNPNKKWNPFIGLSVYHLNKPDQASTGIKSKMPMRFNINGGSNYKVNNDLKLQPSFLYMYQGRAQEVNIMLLAFYHMKDTYFDLLGGVSCRWQDSFSVHGGLKQGGSTYRISYDFVTSPLKAYSGRRGGIELGVIYTGFKRGTHANF